MLLFITNFIPVERDGKIKFVPDYLLTILVGIAFIFAGLMGIFFPNKNLIIVSIGFSLFILYGIVHFVIIFAVKNEIDLKEKKIFIKSFWKNAVIPFENAEIIIDKYRMTFIISVIDNTGKSYKLGKLSLKKGEIKIYILAEKLEKNGLKVIDKTCAVGIAKDNLSSKVNKISENKITINIPFNEMPKDFMIFSGFLLLFAIFTFMIIPPKPAWCRLFFPGTALFMSLFTFFIGNKDALSSWEIEKFNSTFKIRRYFLGYLISEKTVDKNDIIKVVPRHFVYRSDKYSSFEKGLEIHVITHDNVYRIGALLSSNDVKILIDFFNS